MRLVQACLLAGLLFANQASLLAGLCLGNGCRQQAMASTSYCPKHGCKKGRSVSQTCTLPEKHAGACTVVNIGK